MALRTTYFQEEWLLEPEFKGIIVADPNDKKNAVCLVCKNKKIHLSNMGRGALLSHIGGKIHQKKQRARDTSFGMGLFASTKSANKSVTSGEDPSVDPDDVTAPVENGSKSFTDSAGAASTTPPAAQQHRSPIVQGESQVRGLQRYMIRDDVTRAEIWWSLHAVTSHSSLRGAASACKVFPRMFTDSIIASKIELGRTKLSYVIVHGLAPYFHDLLVKELNDCDAFVVFFDESLNKFSQQQQMDIAVRYWSNSTDEVTSRYFSSAFLGKATATDLLDALIRVLESLIVKKMIQVSMDGPNVNLKLLKDLELYLKRTKDPNEPVFMYMGTCGLHVLNNAFKGGFSDKSTSWNVISYLRSVYNLFKDVPSRKSDLIRYSESSLLPLKFCQVRWLNNSAVAVRGKELLPNLDKFKAGIESDKSHKGIKSASYSSVKEAIKDKLMPAKLAFFSYIAKEIEPFLTRFQSDFPLAPFLFTELNALLVFLA